MNVKSSDHNDTSLLTSDISSGGVAVSIETYDHWTNPSQGLAVWCRCSWVASQAAETAS